jgi:hypothetical protein
MFNIDRVQSHNSALAISLFDRRGRTNGANRQRKHSVGRICLGLLWGANERFPIDGWTAQAITEDASAELKHPVGSRSEAIVWNAAVDQLLVGDLRNLPSHRISHAHTESNAPIGSA